MKELLPHGVSQKHSIIDLDLNTKNVRSFLDTENDLLNSKTIEKDIPMTKRVLLSLVSSILHKLGILTPAIRDPKQIFQLSWGKKIDWDDPLSLDLEIRWTNWLINLLKINHISLPRWYGLPFVGTSCIESDIFAEALNSAIGTVAFFDIKSKIQ